MGPVAGAVQVNHTEQQTSPSRDEPGSPGSPVLSASRAVTVPEPPDSGWAAANRSLAGPHGVAGAQCSVNRPCCHCGPSTTIVYTCPDTAVRAAALVWST